MEDEDEGEREKKYKKRWGKDLDVEKDRRGSSNAGEYTDVDKDEFCGPAGGAAPGTYPVNTRKRAIAAKSYARNAPNPAGQSILSKYFPGGVSPAKLAMGAIIPTIILALCYMAIPQELNDPQEAIVHTLESSQK